MALSEKFYRDYEATRARIRSYVEHNQAEQRMKNSLYAAIRSVATPEQIAGIVNNPSCLVGLLVDANGIEAISEPAVDIRLHSV